MLPLVWVRRPTDRCSVSLPLLGSLRLEKDPCNRPDQVPSTLLIPPSSLPCDLDKNTQFIMISCLLLMGTGYIIKILPSKALYGRDKI